MSPRGPELTPLQQAILGILWEAGEASVVDVRAALRGRYDLTVNSVGTLLKRLEERGYVTRRRDGRRDLFRAAVDRDDVGPELVAGLAEDLYRGRAADLFAHLLDATAVTREELETIERLLAKARRRRG